MQVAAPDIARFYQASIVGLAALDAQAPVARRFGPDADARWNAFRGALDAWDRIDLLVRDAAVMHPAGFAPRVVFGLQALADDEPFGPGWPGAEPTTAAELLRGAIAPPAADRKVGIVETLARAAKIWGLPTVAAAATSFAKVGPSTQLLLVGASSIQAAAHHFADRRDLDLSDQAVVLADGPGTKQLFGLALALLGARRPSRLAPLATTAAELEKLEVRRIDVAIIDADHAEISADQRAAVTALARSLGAA